MKTHGTRKHAVFWVFLAWIAGAVSSSFGACPFNLFNEPYNPSINVSILYFQSGSWHTIDSGSIAAGGTTGFDESFRGVDGFEAGVQVTGCPSPVDLGVVYSNICGQTYNIASCTSITNAGAPSWTGYPACATAVNHTANFAENWSVEWKCDSGATFLLSSYAFTLGPGQSETYCVTNHGCPGTLILLSDFTPWGTNDFSTNHSGPPVTMPGPDPGTNVLNPGPVGGGNNGGGGGSGVVTNLAGTQGTNGISQNPIAAAVQIGAAEIAAINAVGSGIGKLDGDINGELNGLGTKMDTLHSDNLVQDSYFQMMTNELGHINGSGETNAQYLSNIVYEAGSTNAANGSASWSTGTNLAAATQAGLDAYGDTVTNGANSAISGLGSAPSVDGGSLPLTIDNPFGPGSFSYLPDDLLNCPGFSAWCKQIVGWLATVAFMFWFASRYMEVIRTMSQTELGGVPDLTATVAGFGGNIVGVGFALLVPLVFVGLWVGLFSYLFSTIVTAEASGYWTTNPLSGVAGGGDIGATALYVLNLLVPVGYLLALLWTRLTLAFTIPKLAMIAVGASRFLFGK